MSRKFIAYLLLGLLALTADFTYEGGRSILGPYLNLLGASLLIAASTTLGELLSYGSRIISGILTLRIRSSWIYWALIFIGYGLNLFSVPLMGFSNSWTILFTLIMVERFGKGLRAPVKDVLVGETGEELGFGIAYSVHEFMDQIGAVFGPLAVAVLTSSVGIRSAYIYLLIPALASIAILINIYIINPDIQAPQIEYAGGGVTNKRFITYLLGVSTSTMIMISWIHGSYRFQDLSIEYIGLLYTLAMLADAFAAVIFGLLYHYTGRYTLLLIPTIIGISTYYVVIAKTAIIYAVLWGIAMGGVESIYKSYLAETISPDKRGFAFGLLSLSIGVGMLVGNIIYVYLSGLQAIIYTISAYIFSISLMIYSIH